MTAIAHALSPDQATQVGSAIPLRTQARRAGLLYLAAGVTTPFALLYVPRAILVSGDPTATADRLHAAPWIVELGIASQLLN